MIERIFLDLDDVCNTLGPHVLRNVGCNIGSSDYSKYPGQFGWDTHLAANYLLGWERFPTAASLWSSLSRSVWNTCPESDIFHWLLDLSATVVGRENVYTATSPTKDPECLAGKLEWIHDHFPDWMHRQFAITPRKHLFARPGALLIDDYGENTRLWQEYGGVAVMVPRPWNCLWGTDPRTYLERNLDFLLHQRRAAVV
jgi:hypothetical protein